MMYDFFKGYVITSCKINIDIYDADLKLSFLFSEQILMQELI